MLILTRRVGESLLIGDDVKVTILGVTASNVRFGIDAPKDMIARRFASASSVARWRRAEAQREPLTIERLLTVILPRHRAPSAAVARQSHGGNALLGRQADGDKARCGSVTRSHPSSASRYPFEEGRQQRNKERGYRTHALRPDLC